MAEEKTQDISLVNFRHILDMRRLDKNKSHAFSLAFEQPALDEAAALLDVQRLRKFSFRGEIRPEGKADWRLEAMLGASVTQSCVVTLEPVRTRIDAPVSRLYKARTQRYEADSVIEMDPDETVESLPLELDLALVALEAIALDLPLYPRRADAALDHAMAAPPGVAPLKEEELKPFAGLQALKEQIAAQKDEESSKDEES